MYNNADQVPSIHTFLTALQLPVLSIFNVEKFRTFFGRQGQLEEAIIDFVDKYSKNPF